MGPVPWVGVAAKGPRSDVLILLKHSVYYSLDILTPDAKLSRPINFIDGGNVLDVKFSLDKSRLPRDPT
jgi:hypothetical protein